MKKWKMLKLVGIVVMSAGAVAFPIDGARTISVLLLVIGFGTFIVGRSQD